MPHTIYLSILCALVCCGVLQPAMSSPEASHTRTSEDTRKFQANHILWRLGDTYDSRRTHTHHTTSPTYLRSGSVVGMREIADPSTLTFELATGSRLGHVGIMISMADAAEVLLKFIDRGGGMKEEEYTNPGTRETRKRTTLHNIEAAHAPYIEFVRTVNDGNWTRTNEKGETVKFHPYQKEDGECIDWYKFISAPKGEYALGTLYWLIKGGLHSKSDEEFYEALKEIRQQVYEGKHTRYTGDWRIGRSPYLDTFLYLHCAPSPNAGEDDLPQTGVQMDVYRPYPLNAIAYPYLGDFNTPHNLAIFYGHTSVVEPARDLTIEEVEKLIFYTCYLESAEATYNYSQSHAGLYCQNCSEFVHNAFKQIGYQVGHAQRMDSLNINSFRGALRNLQNIAKKHYIPENIVITPKSVMQTAVPYTGTMEIPDAELPPLPMRVVESLDCLAIAETISDHQIWREWRTLYRTTWRVEAYRGILLWAYVSLAKFLLGNPFQSLSKEPFETHSKEGLVQTIVARYTHTPFLGITMGIVSLVGAVGTITTSEHWLTTRMNQANETTQDVDEEDMETTEQETQEELSED